MDRIIVFTTDPNYTVRKGVVSLLERNPDLRVLMLIHRPARTAQKLLKSQFSNLSKNGWRWIPYQLGEIVRLTAEKLTAAVSETSPRPGDQYSLDALRADSRMELQEYRNINGAEAIEAARQFRPDLGISLAAPILKAPLFALPRLGTINLHKGKVPEYRGMPPAFWELWNDEASVGCTVHFVEEGLDTGAVIARGQVARQKYSTVQGLRLTLDELGIELVNRAVDDLKSDTVQGDKQVGAGKTYRKPTLRQVAELERRLESEDRGSSARRFARTLASTGYLGGLRPLLRLKNRLTGTTEIVVLLYHRVSDEFRDGVTVGIEQFDQQMAYLRRHYRLAAIDEVLSSKPRNARGKPVVAVTFDDGYLDNYQNAVPILLRHRIPAAFFVSTGMIGQPVGFAHDLQKLGRALPNMNWEQLREMQALGFTIGSHTVTHLNCAKASQDELRAELVQSKRTLQEELALEDVIFAYPFGGRSDMTEQALDVVKETGYAACLSAYGGVNRHPVETFNVLRLAVSSGFQFSRFAARVEGW